jgi:hypothetical protein
LRAGQATPDTTMNRSQIKDLVFESFVVMARRR